MNPSLKLAIISVAAAIAITSTMDATSLFAFSALPLCLLLAIFWFLGKPSRRDMGFVLGRGRDYGLAVLYPIAVIGTISIVAALAGAVDVSHADWTKAVKNLLLVAVSTWLIAIITEEGFFRGWLFAALKVGGQSPRRILIGTSLVFSLWHLSAVTLTTGFDLPAWQVPVFMLNAAVIGLIWGLLRMLSGSIIVSSLSHGVWNAMDYVLYAYGTKVGALGVVNTAVFGPEVGVLGLVANILFAALLWRWWASRPGKPA